MKGLSPQILDLPKLYHVRENIGTDQFNKYTIRAGTGKLVIGSGVTRNEQNVVRIMVHEIESHLLQRQNVFSGPPTLLLRTQYDREMYAEGMAIYNEITTGTITKSAYDLYFHRFEAVLMIDKSLRANQVAGLKMQRICLDIRELQVT